MISRSWYKVYVDIIEIYKENISDNNLHSFYFDSKKKTKLFDNDEYLEIYNTKIFKRI